MSTVALLLVLVAAFLHAGWNLVLHRTPDRSAAIVAAVGMCGLVLLPAAVADPPTGAWGLVAVSALAETSYALTLAAAYGRGELSLAYPIGRGTAPLLVVVGGWLVLEQVPGPLEVLGAALLGAGLAVLATVGREAGRAGAVGFAVLTGASIAVYSVVDARAVRTVSPIGYLAVVFLLEAVLLAATIRFDWTRVRRQLGQGARIALGSVGAYLLVLLAFQRADAGRVATLRETSVLLAILLARERLGPWIWLGTAMCVAGAVLAAI